jgi:succinate dehydrogenase / fumarate reductase cytochrome b subunit
MSTAAADAASASNGSSFFRSRLGSLLAMAPLGVWTIIHLWNNLAAFRGGRAWESAVTEHQHAAAELVGSFLVMAPLLIHTFWGLARLRVTRPNVGSYGFFENWKFLLQRLSALGVLLFLGAHIWLAKLEPRLVHGRPEPFADIAREMRHHTPTLVVYTLGTLGVAYHLANGLHTFLMSWGIVSSRQALKKVEWLAYATFVVLLTMSWGAIYALWKAGA